MESIVKRLEEAAAAYYNTGEPIMTDDEYDELRDQLPTDHPFLKKVGAVVTEGTVKLPVPMPSLNKIKTAESIATFAKLGGPWVLSEKLDGISALWIPQGGKLYLRGDGAVGQDVSHIVKMGVKGLKIHLGKGFMVRGELVVRRDEPDIKTIGRSWVNGLLHQSSPDKALVSKIRFVAYEIMSADLTRMQQFEALEKKGYELPWHLYAETLDSLETHLKERREKGIYDTDGIVVGQNRVPAWHNSSGVSNPKDMVAFKMVLTDQCAITKIITVHWNLSNQGYFIPRLEIEPVKIGGALISFVTGHNAKLVKDKGLGPGAVIRIRRSGDVIPTIDSLITSVVPSLPSGAVWDANEVHLCRPSGSAVTDELLESRLKHFASSLEIEGLGPGLVKKLVAGGIKTPYAFWTASAAELSALVGDKTGVNLHAQKDACSKRLTEMDLMIASSCMPRGVGHTKLKSLFELRPNPRHWVAPLCEAPDGWSVASYDAFRPVVSTYEKWRREEFPQPAYPIQMDAPVPVATGGKIVCFTGFRDKELEKKMVAVGFTVASSMSKKVEILLIADDEEPKGAKVDAARASGIPVMRRSEFVNEYHL